VHWLVATCPSNLIAVPFLRRDPALEYDPTLACHGEQVAVRGGFGRVARHPIVRTVVADESLKVGQQCHAPDLAPACVQYRPQDAVMRRGCQRRASFT